MWATSVQVLCYSSANPGKLPDASPLTLSPSKVQNSIIQSTRKNCWPSYTPYAMACRPCGPWDIYLYRSPDSGEFSHTARPFLSTGVMDGVYVSIQNKDHIRQRRGQHSRRCSLMHRFRGKLRSGPPYDDPLWGRRLWCHSILILPFRWYTALPCALSGCNPNLYPIEHIVRNHVCRGEQWIPWLNPCRIYHRSMMHQIFWRHRKCTRACEQVWDLVHWQSPCHPESPNCTGNLIPPRTWFTRSFWFREIIWLLAGCLLLAEHVPWPGKHLHPFLCWMPMKQVFHFIPYQSQTNVSTPWPLISSTRYQRTIDIIALSPSPTHLAWISNWLKPEPT